MNFWILSCNPKTFDLHAFRDAGQELTSWSVARFREELAAGDPFALWITGPKGGLVARGRLTGPPELDSGTPKEYWNKDPGVRWYAQLEVEHWLDAPVPRELLVKDPVMATASLVTQPFAGNPHRLTREQWDLVVRLFAGAGAGVSVNAGAERLTGTGHAAIGRGYRAVSGHAAPAPAVPSAPDPALLARSVAVHRRLQDGLAAAAAARGLVVLSPRPPSDPEFDLAWHVPERADAPVSELTVCEIKSLTGENESSQLRSGLGQLLDYQDQLTARGVVVRAVLWVERAPREPRWVDLCRRAGVQLAWPGMEEDVLS